MVAYSDKEAGPVLNGSFDRDVAILEDFASDTLVVLEHLVDVDEGVTVLEDFLLAVHDVLLELSVCA